MMHGMSKVTNCDLRHLKQRIMKRKPARVSLANEVLYSRIFIIRKQKVMLDFHLAELYEVPTKVLNQAVKRNKSRFPKDFMFQLKKSEWSALRSQFVTLDSGRGKYPKYLPFVFTEQGVSMLSSALSSPRAIAVNIQIMRIFVRMRQMISSYKVLLRKIEKLEKAQLDNNEDISSIYRIIKDLLEPSIKDRTPIGFKIQSRN